MGTAFCASRRFCGMALLMTLVMSCYWNTRATPSYAAAFSTHIHPIEQVVDVWPVNVVPELDRPINTRKNLLVLNDAKHTAGEALSSDRQQEVEGEEEEEEEEHAEGPGEQERHHREHEHEAGDGESFVLGKPIKVIKTEAGELHVLPHRGMNTELGRKRIGLGFLTLEPKGLLLPHYVDADSLFLVHKGRAQLSWVDDGDLRDVDLEEGDVFKIESGTVFHIYNADEGQRFSTFGIFDNSAVYNAEMFHSFFVAGGLKPTTVLSGFDEDVLATSFKVAADEVRDVLSSQTRGPIIYSAHRNESSRVWGLGKTVSKFLDMYIGLPSIFPGDSRNKPYNLFKKKADFSNDYGSTAALHGDDYDPLKDVDKGVFFVRLKAGAVLAPHWNPRATEIALVTKGEGEIQIVYPNGTAASTEQVQEGNVFYVPQHFPMCQIASRSGPLEFMGFSTSSRPNHPQFLAGSNSVLKTLDKEILASAFNIPWEHLQRFLDSQSEAVVLPGEPLPPSPSRRWLRHLRSRKHAV